MKQTRQAVRTIKQSILLRCLWSHCPRWPRQVVFTFSCCKTANSFIEKLHLLKCGLTNLPVKCFMISLSVLLDDCHLATSHLADCGSTVLRLTHQSVPPLVPRLKDIMNPSLRQNHKTFFFFVACVSDTIPVCWIWKAFPVYSNVCGLGQEYLKGAPLMQALLDFQEYWVLSECPTNILSHLC